MYESLKNRIISELEDIKKSGRYKNERQIESPQCTQIKTKQKNNVINFCANNYLGLAANKEIQNAAKETIDSHGFGLASVRFICGTQDIHKDLEKKKVDVGDWGDANEAYDILQKCLDRYEESEHKLNENFLI